jgi:hypothetical protein
LTRLAGPLNEAVVLKPRPNGGTMNTTQRTGKPTREQLRYLRILAERTGTTFTPPRSSKHASSEIGRLKRMLEQRGRHEELPEVAGQPSIYSTAPVAEEIEGRGANARWRTSPPSWRGCPALRPARETVLAAYEVGGERREVVGEREAGKPRLVDRAASGTGRRYLIEGEIAGDGLAAVEALVADYVEQAAELDRIPMTASVLAQKLEAREQ